MHASYCQPPEGRRRQREVPEEGQGLGWPCPSLRHSGRRCTEVASGGHSLPVVSKSSDEVPIAATRPMNGKKSRCTAMLTGSP